MIITKKAWKKIWAALVARPAAAVLAGNLYLFTNDFTPGVDVVPGDFVQPLYGDYTFQPVVITGPYTDSGGDIFIHMADIAFTLSGTPHDPVTIYGAYMLDADADVFLAGRFLNPVFLGLVGDTVIVSGDPRISPNAVDVGAWVTEPEV